MLFWVRSEAIPGCERKCSDPTYVLKRSLQLLGWDIENRIQSDNVGKGDTS